MALQKVNRNLLNTGVSDSSDATAITIDSSENVGIRTTSPSAQLQVGSGTDALSGTGTGQICLSGAGQTLAVTGKPAVYHRNGVGLGLYSDALMSFEINGSSSKAEAMRIDSNGQVMISHTSSFAHADADNLAIGDGTNNSGLTIYTGASKESSIIFGNAGTNGNIEAGIKYYHESHGTVANRRAMTFATGGSMAERMRITSAGNVGIGITSPTGAGKILHFNSSSNVADFHITNSVTGTTSTDGFILRVTDPANVEYINREATHQIFYQAGSEKLRIQSGGGISFNGDTAAANALDDYEEGTWTPSLTGNSAATYSVRNGRYTKVGNLVRARCAIKLSGWTSNGTEVEVTGLPYAAVASGYDHDWGAVHISSKPTDHVVVCGVISSKVFFRRQDISSADNGVVGGHVDADTGIMFSVVYQTT
jgi:hypothetical protein